MKIKSLLLLAAGTLVLFPTMVGASEIDDQLQQTKEAIATVEEQQTTAKNEQTTLQIKIDELQVALSESQQTVKELTVQKIEQEELTARFTKSVPVANMNQLQQAGPNQITSQLRQVTENASRRTEILAELEETKAALEAEQAEIQATSTSISEAEERQVALDTELKDLATELQEKEKQQANLEKEKEKADKVKATGFASPLNGTLHVSSGFGYRNDPTGHSGTQHNGIDFTGALGTPILAARDGVVVEAAFGATQGNCVIIKHDNGFYSYYMHLNEISVSVGQTVSVGQQVGTMGTTGSSTGVHLHFGLSTSLWGNYVDPTSYLGL